MTSSAAVLWCHYKGYVSSISTLQHYNGYVSLALLSIDEEIKIENAQGNLSRLSNLILLGELSGKQFINWNWNISSSSTRHVVKRVIVNVNSLFDFHVLIVVTSTFMFWLLPLSLSCSHHQECWVEWFSPHTSFSITCLAPSFTGCYHSLEKYNFPFNDFGTEFYTICFFSAVVTASFILGSKVITYLP